MTKHTRNRIFLWGGSLLVIGLIFWGLTKLGETANQPVTIDPVTDTDWSRGNRYASSTFLTYGDFQCPACSAFEPFLNQLQTDEGNKLKFVFRHFPLPMHPNATPAAIASEAAGVQGKFWEFHDLVYTKQKEWSDSKTPNDFFVKYAEELKLDTSKFTTDLTSSTLKDKINAAITRGNQIGIRATPSFFVNGKQIENYLQYDKFKQAVEDATK